MSVLLFRSNFNFHFFLPPPATDLCMSTHGFSAHLPFILRIFKIFLTHKKFCLLQGMSMRSMWMNYWSQFPAALQFSLSCELCGAEKPTPLMMNMTIIKNAGILRSGCPYAFVKIVAFPPLAYDSLILKNTFDNSIRRIN